MTGPLRLKRRALLAGGVTFFGSLASRAALAQPYTIDARRAAIVIGLDNAPGLIPLRAGVRGAHDMGDFFENEGFDAVYRFTDDNQGEVRAWQIGDQVETLVKDGNLDQLVIFFSGHGTLSGTNEFWLLSRASTRPEEAISVLETAEFAYRSAIPNVVLISDACRSVTSSLNLNGVSGQPIFPSPKDVTVHVDVDRFLAAKAGDVANELPVEVSSERHHEGIFTAAFLKAFREPDADMIHTLGGGEHVIPNRKLREFLVREVDARAQEFDWQLKQVPDARVNSEPEAFMARSAVAPGQGATGRRSVDLEEASVANAIGGILQRNATGRIFQDLEIVRPLASNVREQEAGQLIIDAVMRNAEDYLLDEPGIVAYGQRIGSIVGPGIEAYRFDDGENFDAWRVAITSGAPAATAKVMFDDGSGTMSAVVQGFGVHMTLDEFGIADLRYTPAGMQFSASDPVAILRAMAAEATRNGALRFDDSEEGPEEAARQFANQIRMGKGTDPTLGIYSAYAYGLAYLDEGAQSVHDITRSDVGMSFYDTALLADAFTDDCSEGLTIAPAVPMLRQGWELIRPRNAPLSEVYVKVWPFLKDSLWTTFKPDGMAVLESAEPQQVFEVCPFIEAVNR